MGSTRFDLEKFNGENDFYLWSLKIRAILIQQGLDSALEEDEDSKVQKGKKEWSSSTGADKRIINNKAHNTIILHLSDEVLREVAKEKTASGLWAKLEELFLKKSLAKRLYMKKTVHVFNKGWNSFEGPFGWVQQTDSGSWKCEHRSWGWRQSPNPIKLTSRFLWAFCWHIALWETDTHSKGCKECPGIEGLK